MYLGGVKVGLSAPSAVRSSFVESRGIKRRSGMHGLVRQMVRIILTRNSRANYYLYDAFDPRDFSDKQSYNRAVHQCYLEWQAKYLE